MGCLRMGAAWVGAALAFGLVGCGPERMPFDDVTSGDASGMDHVSPGDAVADTPRTDVRTCASEAECDDGIACTEDACLVGGVCENVPNDRLCPSGDGGAAQRCFPGRGCASASSCTTNGDCDDRVMCTRDVCAAGGVCQHIRDDSQCAMDQVCSYTLGCVARGRCGTDPDCDDGVFCNGPERCVSGTCQHGTAPDCTDTDPCTADLCSESMRMCTHPPVMPCGGTVAPGTYDLAPMVNYSCGAGGVTVNTVMLSTSGGGVMVTGFPVTLTGPAPAMGMFTATGMENRGGCQWTYNLSGSFTMPRQFRGTWNVSFDFCSAALGCLGGFGEVTGTMR